LLSVTGKGDKGVTRRGCFAAVLQYRLGQRGGATIVQIGCGGTHSPQVFRQKYRSTGAFLVDVLGKTWSHIVAFHIPVQGDNGPILIIGLKNTHVKHGVAGSIGNDVVRLVLGQIKGNRKCRIHPFNNGILAAWKRLIAIMLVLTWLTENRVVDGQFLRMALAATNVDKLLFPPADRICSQYVGGGIKPC